MITKMARTPLKTATRSFGWLQFALALAVLMPASLAGCSETPRTSLAQADSNESQSQPNESQSQPSAHPGEEVYVVTDPHDRSHLKMANSTVFIHDYWGGQSRIKIVDATIVGVTSGICQRCGILLPLPDGATVFPGTEQIEVTLGWDETVATPGTMELWSRAQSGGAAQLKSSGIVQSGQPFPLPITPEDSDAPGALITKWGFALMFVPTIPGNPALFHSNIHFIVELVRDPAKPLPRFAYPHPPSNANETILHDFVEFLASVNLPPDFTLLAPAVSPGSNVVCGNGCFRVSSPMKNRIIQHEPLKVTLSWSTIQPGTQLGLAYHGAENTTWRILAPIHENATSASFDFEASSLEADSPYSTRSSWQFFPYSKSPPATAVNVDYTIHVAGP